LLFNNLEEGEEKKKKKKRKEGGHIPPHLIRVLTLEGREKGKGRGRPSKVGARRKKGSAAFSPHLALASQGKKKGKKRGGKGRPKFPEDQEEKKKKKKRGKGTNATTFFSTFSGMGEGGGRALLFRLGRKKGKRGRGITVIFPTDRKERTWAPGREGEKERERNPAPLSWVLLRSVERGGKIRILYCFRNSNLDKEKKKREGGRLSPLMKPGRKRGKGTVLGPSGKEKRGIQRAWSLFAGGWHDKRKKEKEGTSPSACRKNRGKVEKKKKKKGWGEISGSPLWR